MKRFKAVAIIRHPQDLVWATIRDELVRLEEDMDNISEIRVIERTDLPDGSRRVVNEWHAKAPVPAVLQPLIRPEMLAWTDTATWDEGSYVCRWVTRPHFQPERVRCQGETRYEPAIGGRGTRVTFEGTFEVTSGALGGAIESFATQLIPHNFRHLTNAAERYLGQR